jgi:hypothetical protein
VYKQSELTNSEEISMKLFVWDFHGVLEKGNDGAVVEITNIALQRFGYSRRMTIQEGEFLSGKR